MPPAPLQYQRAFRDAMRCRNRCALSSFCSNRNYILLVDCRRSFIAMRSLDLNAVARPSLDEGGDKSIHESERRLDLRKSMLEDA